MDEHDVVVLGGGATGLSLAYRLGQRGIPSLVLEARSQPGGLAGSFVRDGYVFDYGPHNIHCRTQQEADTFRELLGAGLVEHRPRAKILFRGKLVDYPLKGVKALTVLDPLTAASCAASFLTARLMRRLRASADGDYRQWIVSRFGRGLYDIYFGPYSQKVWGTAPEMLSPVVAEKRIPTTSLTQLLFEALLGRRPGYHPEHPDHVLSFYPRQGAGQLMQMLAQRIAESGGRVLLGSRVTQIAGSGATGYVVSYRAGRAVRTVRASLVCSTVPLPNLVQMLSPAPPDEVRRAAGALQYRSVVLLYLLFDEPQVLENPWVYFSDTRIPFNRVYELSQFSKAVVPLGKTALCFESSCWRGKGTWQRSSTELTRLATEVLRSRWHKPGRTVVASIVKRFDSVYPVFDLGYEQRLGAVLEHVTERGNLVTLGRQGLFTYVNVDHCFDMGFELAEAIASGKGVEQQGLFDAYRPPGAFDELMDGA